jgi:hypothetical protein
VLAKQLISVVLLLCPALSWTYAVAQSVEQNQNGNAPDAPAAHTPLPQNGNQQRTHLIILVTRRSYWFPDLATNFVPLSRKQKFELFLKDSISAHAIAGSVASAGVGQALNWYAGLGQGAAGYGKRFGASMARSSSNNFFGTFLLATIFRQDPRFFVRKDPTFWNTVKYSLHRIVITRSDSGAEAFNSSGLLGPVAGEALASAYLPMRNRTVGNTFARYAGDIGWRVAGNFVREYWPTVSRHLLPSKRTVRNQ